MFTICNENREYMSLYFSEDRILFIMENVAPAVVNGSNAMHNFLVIFILI